MRVAAGAWIGVSVALAGLASRTERIHLAPEGEPARTYSTRWRPTPAERHLAAFLRLRTRAVRFSPCLARAAHAYAAALPPGGAPELPLEAVEFLLHWAGCPDASAAATVLYTSEDGASEALDAVERLLGKPLFATTTHVGLARVPATQAPYRWRWGILLAVRRFDLASLPASAPTGARLPFQVRLDPGLAEPRLLLLEPGEQIEEIPLGHSGTTAVGTVQLPDEPGTVWIELAADGDTGPMVVALFPVAVGSAPPAEWSGLPPPREPPGLSPREAEQLMLRLVNRDRGRHGLPSLAWDERLAAVARAHSMDMAMNGFFGHESPTHGGHRARLTAAGYRALASAENVSHAQSVAEAEQALMRSPGHRANILDPRMQRVGIGIAEDPGGELRWFVTQIFTLPAPDLDAAAWQRRLRRRLAQAWGRELAADPHLDGVAEKLAARVLAADEPAASLTRRVLEELRARGRPVSRVQVHVARAWEPGGVELPENVPASSVGFGVALPEDARPPAVVLVVVAPAG